MISMEKKNVIKLIKELISSGGMPRNIRENLEETLKMFGSREGSDQEKLAQVLSILDDASGDPNVSAQTRTLIWSVVSQLESREND